MVPRFETTGDPIGAGVEVPDVKAMIESLVREPGHDEPRIKRSVLDVDVERPFRGTAVDRNKAKPAPGLPFRVFAK